MFPQTPYSLYVYQKARQEEFIKGNIHLYWVRRASSARPVVTDLPMRIIWWFGLRMVMLGLSMLERSRHQAIDHHKTALP
jgi:hypothetical protein